LRILFLTQFFHPEPIFKGLPFARALQQRGHSIEVLTGFPNYPGGRVYPGYRVRAFQRETVEGIPVMRVPLYASHDRSRVRRVLNYLSFGTAAYSLGCGRAQAPDLIYLFNLVTLGPAARRLRRRHRAPVLMDVQDLWPESVVDSGMLRREGAFVRALRSWCRREYRSVDALTVLSPGFKRNLCARGVSPERIEVIYNWCDEGSIRVSEPGAEFRRRYGLHERFNLVFAGTMGNVQGLDAVIAAARLLARDSDGVRITFLGGGVELPRLKEVAAGVSTVQFLPACSQVEVGSFLGAADVLLVHLKREAASAGTIPSKVQAYLFAGKPILCGVEGDSADLVRRAGAGVCCEPENAEEIAGCIRVLQRMPREAREEMGDRGHSFYMREICFAKGLERFEKAFERAIERHRAMAGDAG